MDGGGFGFAAKAREFLKCISFVARYLTLLE